jgi:hypothetical protein
MLFARRPSPGNIRRTIKGDLCAHFAALNEPAQVRFLANNSFLGAKDEVSIVASDPFRIRNQFRE